MPLERLVTQHLDEDRDLEMPGFRSQTKDMFKHVSRCNKSTDRILLAENYTTHIYNISFIHAAHVNLIRNISLSFFLQIHPGNVQSQEAEYDAVV